MPRIPTLALILTLSPLAAFASTPAAAQTTPPAQAEAEATPQQQFSTTLRQRNALTRKLYRLDADAAAAVKRGERPLAVHAQQQSVQDELNVAEMRLAILASRHGFTVPEPPPSPEAEAARRALQRAGGHDDARAHAQTIAADGLARTDALVREQVNLMLAQLSFRGFPTGSG